VNGVKDTWAMAELDYCDVETDLCWGPFHSLMNVAMNVIEKWKGERIKKNSVIAEYCKLTATHPDLYTEGTINFKWEITNDLQDEVIIFSI
jgi:hypothetical protein